MPESLLQGRTREGEQNATEVESLWSRDVRRLKQAIEHSLEAQRLAESVSAEHASEVREIYFSCCCRLRMADSCAIERCHA